jgi:hypothetical protein
MRAQVLREAEGQIIAWLREPKPGLRRLLALLHVPEGDLQRDVMYACASLRVLADQCA